MTERISAQEALARVDAVTDFIFEVREHTWSQSHSGGFNFDLSHDAAVERLYALIRRCGGHIHGYEHPPSTPSADYTRGDTVK